MKNLRSIKWQFQLGQLLLLAGVLATLLTLYYSLHKKELIAAIDRDLQQTLMFSMPAFRPALPERPAGGRPHRPSPDELPPADGRSSGHAHKTLEEAVAAGRYAIALEGKEKEIRRFGNVRKGLSYDDYPDRSHDPVLHSRDGYREVVFWHRGSTLVVIGQPLSILQHALQVLRIQLVLIGTVILLVGFLVGLIISRRVLHPIVQISKTAEAISTGNSNERIELADAPIELEGLARTLNATFDHLDDSLNIQKRFSADASHELRTPLSVIIAQCQAALDRDRSTDEYKSMFSACLRAGERMKTMANSLLELTRIDHAGASLVKAPCDLNEIVREASEEADHLSGKHPVTFQALDSKLMADVDWNRIHQVILNLLNNAIIHNPNGCSIHVELQQKNNAAVITIRDTGSGIPADALPHIFNRFYRVDKSRSRGHGGTGLGLAIVKKLVEAHNGTIIATSLLGKGTTFTITLSGKL